MPLKLLKLLFLNELALGRLISIGHILLPSWFRSYEITVPRTLRVGHATTTEKVEVGKVSTSCMCMGLEPERCGRLQPTELHKPPLIGGGSPLERGASLQLTLLPQPSEACMGAKHLRIQCLCFPHLLKPNPSWGSIRRWGPWRVGGLDEAVRGLEKSEQM